MKLASPVATCLNAPNTSGTFGSLSTPRTPGSTLLGLVAPSTEGLLGFGFGFGLGLGPGLGPGFGLGGFPPPPLL